MENFVDKLKEYFNKTPREQVLLDWEESKEFDTVGATVEEFIENSSKMDKQIKYTANIICQKLP